MTDEELCWSCQGSGEAWYSDELSGDHFLPCSVCQGTMFLPLHQRIIDEDSRARALEAAVEAIVTSFPLSLQNELKKKEKGQEAK